MRDVTRESGAGFDLRVMAAHGGTISIEAKQLARTLISGPIGGVIGAKYLVDKMRENASGSGASQPPLPADEARAERAAAAARPAGTSGHPARNVVCTDIGGTSFDIALITDGEFQIRQIPELGRFQLNLPLVQVDSIGAGT